MRFADIEFPQSLAVDAALEVATYYCSPALLNHCQRSYIWCAVIADRDGLRYDDELLYVAALLHDLGLVREFDGHFLPFEEAGGQVAWVFAAGAGWPLHRRIQLSDIIVRHMWDSVDPADDPESHLLEAATSADISGRGVGDLGDELRADVMRAFPSLELPAEFAACFRSQADRKPESAAARATASGIADRLAANPLHSDPAPLAPAAR